MKTFSRIASPIVFIVLTTFFICGTALADGMPEELPDREYKAAQPCKAAPYRYVDHRWFFEASPYLWAPGMFGDIDLGNPTAGISADPLNMVQNRDIGAGFTAEVGWCKVSLLVDLFHLDLSTDRLDDDAGELELRKFITNAVMTWTFTPHTNFELGPVAGIRYVHLRPELVSPADNDEPGTFAQTEGWIDPILGMRARFDAPGPLYIPIYGDFGGIGFGSELTWQAYGAVGVDFSRFEMELGWRHLFIDFEGDDLDYTLHSSGPLLGINFKF